MTDDPGKYPFVADTSALSQGEIRALIVSIWDVIKEHHPGAVQAALLHTLFLIWEMNKVTQEQARDVLHSWIGLHLSTRSQ